jgi:hypothetical protein
VELALDVHPEVRALIAKAPARTHRGAEAGTVHLCDPAPERAQTRLGVYWRYAQPDAVADTRSDPIAHAKVRTTRAPHMSMDIIAH